MISCVKYICTSPGGTTKHDFLRGDGARRVELKVSFGRLNN